MCLSIHPLYNQVHITVYTYTTTTLGGTITTVQICIEYNHCEMWLKLHQIPQIFTKLHELQCKCCSVAVITVVGDRHSDGHTHNHSDCAHDCTSNDVVIQVSCTRRTRISMSFESVRTSSDFNEADTECSMGVSRSTNSHSPFQVHLPCDSRIETGFRFPIHILEDNELSPIPACQRDSNIPLSLQDEDRLLSPCLKDVNARPMDFVSSYPISSTSDVSFQFHSEGQIPIQNHANLGTQFCPIPIQESGLWGMEKSNLVLDKRDIPECYRMLRCRHDYSNIETAEIVLTRQIQHLLGYFHPLLRTSTLSHYTPLHTFTPPHTTHLLTPSQETQPWDYEKAEFVVPQTLYTPSHKPRIDSL